MESPNEIVEFGESEEFFCMISDSNALQDIAGEYDSSSDDDSKIRSADDHSLRCCLTKVFNGWAALVVKKSCVLLPATGKLQTAATGKLQTAPGHLLQAEIANEVCLHPDLLCPSGYSLVDYVENIHCPVCKAKVDVDVSSCTESCSGCRESFAVSIALPSSDGQGESDDDAVDSNVDDKVSCSPS